MPCPFPVREGTKARRFIGRELATRPFKIVIPRQAITPESSAAYAHCAPATLQVSPPARQHAFYQLLP